MTKTGLSWLVKGSLFAVLLSLGSSHALADPSYTIRGSTTGQFYLGSAAQGSSVNGLSFQGDPDFGPTTVTTGSQKDLSLGTFSLSTLYSNFNPYDFKLTVNFTAPNVGGTVFTADVSGVVSFMGGQATVNFLDNGPRHFSFSTPTLSGAFDLILSDVTVSDFSSATLKGTITNVTANPEPATIVLTSALMGGMLILFRKRLRSS